MTGAVIHKLGAQRWGDYASLVGLQRQLDATRSVFCKAKSAAQLVGDGMVQVKQLFNAFYRRQACRAVFDAPLNSHQR